MTGFSRTSTFMRLFIAIAMSLPVLARASANEFLAAGMEIPQQLQAKGHSRFGELDLATLVSQMGQVRVIFSSDLTAAKRNQNGRISARWEVTAQSKTIRVYTWSWKRWTEQRSLLALHEYLGILGYEDDNYWLSTQMWTLATPESGALSSTEKANIERSIEARSRIRMAGGGGGVVGVGGGGEGGTLWARQRLIKKYLGEMNSGTMDREQAIGGVYGQLESNMTLSYPGFESAETKRRVREKYAANKMYCMVSAGLCPAPAKNVTTSLPCTCRGNSGSIIWTDSPWQVQPEMGRIQKQ